MSEPLAGNHSHLYDIEVQFEVVTVTLEDANIYIDGLFLNADGGFDSKELRKSVLIRIFRQTFVIVNVTGM